MDRKETVALMRIYVKQYTLFFSWQNDQKGAKRMIQKALKKVQKTLADEGIELLLDEDTRGRTGNRDIVHAVLDKIENCDIFLADVTPVTSMYVDVDGRLPKHMPNSNVMFEYGYALHCKGESRMITLAKMGMNEHVEYLPFDINHHTVIPFKDSGVSNHLTKQIRRIIEDVERERAEYVPEYECGLFFLGEILSTEKTIHPIYKRICYVAENPQNEYSEEKASAEMVLDSTTKLTDLMEAVSREPRASQMFGHIKRKVNKGYSFISLWFKNSGQKALENCELTIDIKEKGAFFSAVDYERREWLTSFSQSKTRVYDKSVQFHIDAVNPGADYMLEGFFVYASSELDAFRLTWKLSSKTYQTNGSLKVIVEPSFIEEKVQNEEKAGTEEIGDYIVVE